MYKLFLLHPTLAAVTGILQAERVFNPSSEISLIHFSLKRLLLDTPFAQYLCAPAAAPG